MGNISIQEIKDIREFYCGNLPNPMSGSFEKINTTKLSNNEFIASFFLYFDIKSRLSLYFDGENLSYKN